MRTETRDTILLVEDEAIVAMAEEAMIRGFGYDVVVARGGEEAVERVAEDGGVSMVLMDIDLGSGMDGTEAAMRMLERRELPIVFLTSHAEDEIVSRVKGITNYGYVLKGSGEFVLRETIESAFNLFRAHARYRLVFDNSPTGLCLRRMLYDAEGRPVDCECIEVNRAFCEQTGMEQQQLLGSTLRELYPEGDEVEELLGDYARVVRTGEELHMERYFTPLRRWFRMWIYPADGDLFTLAVHNVSGERETEEQIRRERAEYRRLFEDHSAVKLIIDAATGDIVDANRAAAGYYGWSRDDLCAMRIQDINALSDEDIRRRIEQASRRDRTTFEFVHRLADGTLRDVEVYSAPVVWGGRECLHSIVIDVTERTTAARRVESLLEEKELLMREVHHRIKNDLSFVQSLLGLQASQASRAETSEALREASQRVGVVSRLYERFYRAGSFSRVSLPPLVRELVSDLRTASVPDTVELEVDVDEIEVGGRQSLAVALIISEAVRNAVRHASAGDRLAVRVAVRQVDGGSCRVRVTDNGAGFPEAVRRGDAYGYGLTIVNALAQQHHGEVRLRNEQGAVLEADLPVEVNDRAPTVG
ncbi:MAG: PAS domain S-box protein [Spirochaetota bacterium]